MVIEGKQIQVNHWQDNKRSHCTPNFPWGSQTQKQMVNIFKRHLTRDCMKYQCILYYYISSKMFLYNRPDLWDLFVKRTYYAFFPSWISVKYILRWMHIRNMAKISKHKVSVCTCNPGHFIIQALNTQFLTLLFYF